MKIRYLSFFIFFLVSTECLAAGCPQFETALESALKKVLRRDIGAPDALNANASQWATKEAQAYKLKNANGKAGAIDNRKFLQLSDADKKMQNPNVIYFDVENAVQKKLNDHVIRDKEMVDAINNSFMAKFKKNLAEDPMLSKKVEGVYQDYKSLRLRAVAGNSDDVLDVQKRLSEVYKKTNKEFVKEFQKEGMTKLITPRTDEVVDVSTWFLSGTGSTSLEANMAARSARTSGFFRGNATTMSFAKQIDNLHKDVSRIEDLRKILAAETSLLKSGVMLEDIPSKEMIGILRKIKISDCESEAEYLLKIKQKVQSIFGADISDTQILNLKEYFEKVDSLSPPLFQRNRKAIDLSQAKEGIVSVDFTGVGVDNAFEQMRGLSAVDYAQKSKEALLKDAFSKIQTNVDGVTEQMNLAKRAFSSASRDPKDPTNFPLFSGDDGILMPKSKWTEVEKKKVLRELSESADPSKYRVTFMKTELDNGVSLPASERSVRIVRSEGIEKSLRELVTGHGKISSERAKKMIFAIDATPFETGGKYDLFIGGIKPTPTERKIIEDAFLNGIPMKTGESLGIVQDIFK